MLIRCKSFWRILPALQHSCYSSSVFGVNPVLATAASNNENSLPKATEISKRDTSVDIKKPVRGNKKLVSAVFTSLSDSAIDSETDTNNVMKAAIDSKILEADSVDSLLSVADEKSLTSNQALMIVSKLADWATDGKAKIIDFDSDPRFTRLCQKLGHNISSKPLRRPNKGGLSASNFSDLGVVLGIAGDDEAAKLVDTITVPQMIKVLSSLAYKKRRSIPLLRSLAFNIGKSTDDINIKDCADVLYACFQLSFQDEVLFEKICSDLCLSIKTNTKPAVVGSVITSLGCLKYKNTELLDHICEWVMNNLSICRIQDIVSLLLTLAAVDYTPANGDSLFQKLETYIQQADVASPSIWLDVVWALVILNRATASHVSSVLNEEFLDRLAASQLENMNVISKMKLQNINGAAKLLIKDYEGPFLESDSQFLDVQVPRGKDKQLLVTAVIDTLTNLLQSSVYMNTNINTGMGFIIDGEFIIDSNLTPLPLVNKKTGQQIDTTESGARKGTKAAILVLDYHDITRGQADPVGIASLAIRLTEESGYKTITIPYYDFNPRDKLVTRVQYLEQKIKNIFKSSKNLSTPS